MADQRLLMVRNGREIVLAVRHGDEWRSSLDPRNDLGRFLSSLPHCSVVHVTYEDPRNHRDPLVTAQAPVSERRVIALCLVWGLFGVFTLGMLQEVGGLGGVLRLFFTGG